MLYVFIFGVLGVAMERLGYSRPALLLGFVLGETIERYFQVSLKAYGWSFFMRPISLAIIAIALLCLLWPNRRRIAALWRPRMIRAEVLFPSMLFVGVAGLLAAGLTVLGYSWPVIAFPFGAGAIMCALCIVEVAQDAGGARARPLRRARKSSSRLTWSSVAWVFALGGFVYRPRLCVRSGRLSAGLSARQRLVLAPIDRHRRRLAAGDLGTVHQGAARAAADRALVDVVSGPGL